MKITVISAHRGDAALALGLSVGMWLDEGHVVEMVSCFTRSEFAPFSDAGSVHANDRMTFVSATRKREDEAWVRLYRGKLTLTELNMKDAPLRLHCGADEVFGLAVNREEKSAMKIRKAVERSGAVALILPLALDGHVDRVTACEAATAAALQSAALAFYEDMPQAAGMENEWLCNAALAVRPDLKPVLVGEQVTGDALEAVVKRKRRVAWCYDSQIDEAVTAQIADDCRKHGGRERVWANSAWVSSMIK